MEASILISTKKILGVGDGYTAFDLDIITHINAAFATISQLGVGPKEGFFITDELDVWMALGLPDNQLNMVRTYVFLKVRSLFDPPSTSFLIEATSNQIKEFEWRLSALRDEVIYEENLNYLDAIESEAV